MIVIIHDPEYTRPMKLAAILISRYGLKRTVEAWDGVMPLEDGMLAITHIEKPPSLPRAVVVRVGGRRKP
jgi:hypothetical protein